MASEFALVAVDPHQVEQRANAGERRGETARGALRQLSFQLSGAQLGITVTSLVVGFIVEPTIGRAIEPVVAWFPGVPDDSSLGVAVTVGLVLATVAQMLLGELIPKNWAISHPLGTALVLAGPMRLFSRVFGPVIRFLNGSANATVRLFGMEPREELASVRSLEEMDLLIRASTEEGVLDEEASELMARAISFAGKTAADALTPRVDVIALAQDASIVELVRQSLESGHSRFPLYKDDIDEIVGVVHIKDASRIMPWERERTPVSAVMHDALFVPEAAPLPALLSEMRATGRQMAVVVDEYGGTAGVVTLEDILEEIVGEIEDEYDEEEEPSALADDTIVSGMAHSDEVREQTGFEMPDGDYETMAGFLLSLMAHIPDVGERVEYDGWAFEVVEVDGRRIASVRVLRTGAGRE